MSSDTKSLVRAEGTLKESVAQSGEHVAIRVNGVSKCYHLYEKPQDRLRQSIYPRLQRILGREPTAYAREFWALKDISFEVKKGETVGIIGRNGSGKSTLLQLICGTLAPTIGTIETHGRVAALLELGSGFNPEFTGRENVYMNASLLGLSKEEIDGHYSDIVAFADIGDFVDQPVKTYSSGMMVRLAFAVHAQVSPDILIVDEALAVGDVKFQAKCFNQLNKLKDNGTSILLVTHSSEQIVTHCTSAILLEDGKILQAGPPRSVVNQYMDLLFGKEKSVESAAGQASSLGNEVPLLESALSVTEDVFCTRPGYNPYEYRWGDCGASILDFMLFADGQSSPPSICPGQRVDLALSVKFLRDLMNPILGVTIKTKEGVTVYGANSDTLKNESFKSFGRCGQVAYVKASFCCRLAPGDYFISVGIATRHREDITPHDRRYDAIHVEVRSVATFSGLVDLGLELAAKEIAS
jgi:lipopolysaccharide transport system ATP-binding protein